MSERFDQRGMLIIPDPRRRHLKEAPPVVVLTHCYCPQAHDLISERASFNGHPGLIIRVKKRSRKGLIALSPIYGEKVRVALDIDLKSGELLDLRCPVCDTALPVHSQCPYCGGEMVAIFSLPEADLANCVAICNRVDCPNATLVQSGKLVAQSMVEAL